MYALQNLTQIPYYFETPEAFIIFSILGGRLFEGAFKRRGRFFEVITK